MGLSVVCHSVHILKGSVNHRACGFPSGSAESTDRVAHELWVLVETVQTVLSMTNRTWVARCASRSWLDACSPSLRRTPTHRSPTGTRQNSFLEPGAGDAVSLELRQYVLKKTKDGYRGRGMRRTEHGTTTWRKAAVVVGMGSSHDELRSGVWGWLQWTPGR